jgi:short-subunit dehydrogenase
VLHLCRILLPRDILAHKTGQRLQPLRLRPAALHLTLEIEVLYRLRDLETQAGIVRVGRGFRRIFRRIFPRIFGRIRKGLAHLFERMKHPLAQSRRWRVGVLVIEILHLASQIIFVLIERCDGESPLSASQYVEPSVRIPLQYRLHIHRATRVDDAAIARQNDAEFGAGGLRLTDHFLVTIFEDMQRNRVAWEYDETQREQRDHARHDVIIAFPSEARQFTLLPRRRTRMDSLEGKVIIITGASDGIGARLASALRKRGARLTLAARSDAKLRSVAGPADLVVPGDLTEESARNAVIARTVERWGKIDVLINNAGRGSYYSATTTPLSEARAVFELNFFTPFSLAQMAAPYLRQSRGAIVNVSSIAGQISLPWLPVYSASKFALAAITSAQRTELRRDGVNVMGVFPGYVDTDFQSHAAGPLPPDRVVQGKRFAVSAERCAEAIVDGIAHRRTMVVTPRSGWLLVWANRFFPAFMESRMEIASHGQ